MNSYTDFLLVCLIFTFFGLLLLIVSLNRNVCFRRQEPVQRLLYQYTNPENVSDAIDKLDLCSICLSPIQYRNKIQIKCNHLFHTECIDKWTDKNIKDNKLPSCPNCNQNYLERVV